MFVSRHTSTIDPVHPITTRTTDHAHANPHRTAGLCTSSKVYSALTELKHLEGHRSAKFLALLAENLVRKGLLSEQEVVHMLDQVVD